MKRKISLFLILSFSVSLLLAKPLAYNDYEFILKNYVNDAGAVNYADMNEKKLNNFINSINDFTFEEYSKLSKKEQLLFWIEIHNAFMLKIGHDNYPVKRRLATFFLYPKGSVQHLGNLENKRVIVLGDTMTLKTIRNKIIEMDSPRSLFTLTTLTKTSPNLRNSLYDWKFIPRDLDEQTIKFIFNKNNYYLDQERRILYLSPIFKEYADIFKIKNNNLPIFLTEKENKIINFLLTYVLTDDENYLINASFYQIKFRDFDYSINDFVIKKDPNDLLKSVA